MRKNIEMAKINIELRSSDGIFKGLAKQNMLFHQCICELIDNAIAAKKDNSKFRVDIIFKKEDDNIILYVVDNSMGMSFEILSEAIQVGVTPETTNRLNEHGFGLKNALATLTQGGNGKWKVYSKNRHTGKISSVESPYANPVIMDNDDSFPQIPYAIDVISTIVEVEIKVKYIQGVQEKGRPTYDLLKLRKWLLEHLGVIYRAYLLPDSNNNYNIDGEIFVSINTDVAQVKPIEIPLGLTHHKSFDIEIGGTVYPIIYNYGTIDADKAAAIRIVDEPLKSYYTQGISSQGIDIRIGKRVIASKVLEAIWNVTPHNHYNDVAGELIIPDTVPRGKLKTVTTKTDFKNDDSDWRNIFEQIAEKYPLLKNQKKQTEDALKKELISQLKRFANEEDIITSEKEIWPMGVRIDVYWKKKVNNEIIIYEVKTDSATALNLFQLKMYWEGLVEKGEHPSEAKLVSLSYNDKLEEMVKILNTMTPKDGFENFNFKLTTLKEMGLI
jgi:hypothetical protein